MFFYNINVEIESLVIVIFRNYILLYSILKKYYKKWSSYDINNL